MADTRILKTKIEDCVRTWLKAKFNQDFRSVFLALEGVQGLAKSHEFDAVSKDNSIVCSIKTASWKTSGGKRGSGKVDGAYSEMYFLRLVSANEKYLVLTDPEFFHCFSRECSGKLAAGVSLLHCPLAPELCREIELIRVASRAELGFYSD
jgi:hypothetical protein